MPPGLFADLQKILPNGTAHSPYGATESLPVASISAAEVLGETASATAAGKGTCVGRPVREIELKIIAITDAPIASLADTSELPAGEIGEIIVRGPVVTKSYDELPEATALAKVFDSQPGGPAAVWHRLGDLGYLDASGRLWFCGRKVERVTTARGVLYTEPCEQVFRAHPRATRCALIGLGTAPNQLPAIVLETAVRDSSEARALARLSHPNIVGLHDFGRTASGHLYIVMEHVAGADLSRLIRSGNLAVA